MISYKRGPGLWKFNNSLSLDDEFISLIKTSYSAISEKFCDLKDKQLKWEMIKMELRGLIIQYAKRKARNSRDYIESLEQRLAETEAFINNSNEGDGNIETTLTLQEQLKKELQYLYEKRGEGAMFRSKLRWAEQGEKPTRYFFNMEAKNFNKKTITELETSEGVKITGHNQLLQEIENFYQSLYQSEYGGSHELFADFVHSVQLPKLSDDDKENLEGELTIPECRQILKTFNFGKSPDEDCFTVEFYTKFFEFLANDLVESLNTAYSRGELSQKRGAVTLIPKADSDTLKLTNWRPITLLNVDFKIPSKAIAARRIKKVLPQLIHTDQTGFMKDRFIGQNVRLLCDVLEQTELENIPGILLPLDFRKAFHTIEWPMIQQVLSIFNFGVSIKRWVGTFYGNVESSVVNNGFTTRQLKLSRGVRQGCPLSSYLFI